MVSLQEAAALALSFPEAVEQDHHGRPSFRVAGRIFATVPDDEHLNVLLDEEDVHEVLAGGEPACEELRWGSQLRGVRVGLGAVDHAVLAELLDGAWRRKAPRRLVAAAGNGTPSGGGGDRTTPTEQRGE
jgi:hypothetical protein